MIVFHLLPRGTGLIINISSEVGIRPQPLLSLYSATKVLSHPDILLFTHTHSFKHTLTRSHSPVTVSAHLHDTIPSGLLVFWLWLSSLFQIFVTYFSQCLHAEYKSKGIIVQVKYGTIAKLIHMCSSWRKVKSVYYLALKVLFLNFLNKICFQLVISTKQIITRFLWK